MANGIRPPSGRDTIGSPRAAILGDVLPATIIPQIFDSHQVIVYVLTHVSIAAFEPAVALVYPTIERVGRTESDHFIAGRIDAVNVNLAFLSCDLPAIGRHNYSAAAH
jgi:hypothetical protein